MTRSIYDGFEGYRTLGKDDYERALATGMVVPDTNVLLNLYRYTAQARDDLFDVFQRLADRLWVPHRVMGEFWRNREVVARSLGEPVKRARRDLQTECESAITVIRTWAEHVSAPKDRRDKMIDTVRTCFVDLAEQLQSTVDSALAKAVLRTQTDPVLARIDTLLGGRIGPPFGSEDAEGLLAEGMRRIQARIPPGYMDANKPPPYAVGDYFVWEQVLRRASQVECDVVFVTGDVKEDWWRKGVDGPRTELMEELRARAGTRLFMVSPTRLLELAETALGVKVHEKSVEEVATVDRGRAGGAWTGASIAMLLERLERGGHVQAEVIRQAAASGGFVDRATVYRISERGQDQSLRGFTRPVRRITEMLKNEGLLADDAIEALEPVYESDAWTPASGFRVPAELIPFVLAAPSSERGGSATTIGDWPDRVAETWGAKG